MLQTTIQLSRKYDMGLDEMKRLMTIERSLHRLDEAACNGELSPAQERRVERLEKEAQAILDAGHYAAIAYHQSDPRGGALVIVNRKDLGNKNIDSCYSNFGIYV